MGNKQRPPALSLGSCGHLRPVRAVTWANGRTGASLGSVASPVLPRWIWCGCGAVPWTRQSSPVPLGGGAQRDGVNVCVVKGTDAGVGVVDDLQVRGL